MDRIVPESALINAGFELRQEGFDQYRVLQIDNREVRFVQVAHGQYMLETYQKTTTPCGGMPPYKKHDGVEMKQC